MAFDRRIQIGNLILVFLHIRDLHIIHAAAGIDLHRSRLGLDRLFDFVCGRLLAAVLYRRVGSVGEHLVGKPIRTVVRFGFDFVPVVASIC